MLAGLHPCWHERRGLSLHRPLDSRGGPGGSPKFPCGLRSDDVFPISTVSIALNQRGLRAAVCVLPTIARSLGLLLF